MERMARNKDKGSSWNPQAAYDKVNYSINHEWPDWKKKAYNEIFAVSAHAREVSIHK